ncbi:hypothetical protein Ancab_031209 [Ancistrocladus abbreviatus]
MEESLFQRPTSVGDSIATTFSLSFPLSRYFIGDYGELRSDRDYHDGTMLHGCGNYAYSKSLVILDVIWNLASVLLSLFVLLWTMGEKPSTPLRVWIGGYALQCFLHVGFVYFEYRRRINNDVCISSSQDYRSIIKKLELANTMASSFWWVIGFYWIVAGGPALLQDSPCLYWLAVVFLALDVFFMIFCIGMACLIFLALFCCIPFLAIAYAVTIREGASEDDIRALPKYTFRQSNSLRLFAWNLKQVDRQAELGSRNCVNELSLPPDDSECCICLSRYVEGAELCILPCNHHFHFGCISRWLRINATCPLCKFNILGGDTLV